MILARIFPFSRRYFNINITIYRPRFAQELFGKYDLAQFQIIKDKGMIKEVSKNSNNYEIELYRNKGSFPLPPSNYFIIDAKGRQYLNVYSPKLGVYIPIAPLKLNISEEDKVELESVLKMEGYKTYTIAKIKQNAQVLKKPSLLDKYMPLISVSILVVVFVVGMIFSGKTMMDLAGMFKGLTDQLQQISQTLAGAASTVTNTTNVTLVPVK